MPRSPQPPHKTPATTPVTVSEAPVSLSYVIHRRAMWRRAGTGPTPRARVGPRPRRALGCGRGRQRCGTRRRSAARPTAARPAPAGPSAWADRYHEVGAERAQGQTRPGGQREDQDEPGPATDAGGPLLTPPPEARKRSTGGMARPQRILEEEKATRAKSARFPEYDGQFHREVAALDRFWLFSRRNLFSMLSADSGDFRLGGG